MNAALGPSDYLPDFRFENTFMAIWCIEPIKVGEEIYIHYGTDYWMHKAKWIAQKPVELNKMD